MIRQLLHGLCTAALALSSQLACAQATDSVRERAEASFRAGAAAYAAGEYRAAIQALDAAYALTPLPAIAFSLAQAERREYFVTHEPAHLQRAITLYRSYLAQVPSGGRRADAAEALTQLEPLAAAQSASASQAVAAPAANPTRLLITSDAPGARVSLDGSNPVQPPLIREVTPGAHRALAEADGFFPAQRELVALEGELILGELPLRARPSTLVLTAPADADVYLDGSFVAQGGAAVRLELAAGTHRLAVAAKGARVEYRSLTLARGASETVHVTLSRTPQRLAAQVLFVASGAVLATGLVFAGVAVREEGRAQDFLAQLDQGSVTGGELAAYHEHVESRDLYRTLAIASAGTGGALLITALLLRELDRPSARDIQRDARAVPARGADAGGGLGARPLSITPWLGRSLLGAALKHTF